MKKSKAAKQIVKSEKTDYGYVPTVDAPDKESWFWRYCAGRLYRVSQ